MPSGSVSLDAENELDFSLKETSTTVHTYTLTKEDNSISELTGNIFRQNPTSFIDLAHLRKKPRQSAQDINSILGEVER